MTHDLSSGSDRRFSTHGIYPGGQSGNPGSKFYDDYIDNYVALKYNRLWNVSKEVLLKKKNTGIIHFEKATA